MNTISVMIVGVGGQGTLLASKVLGQALVSMDYDVKVSEVHGMSQRGGSVVTYVRYGDEVHSPIVDLARRTTCSPLSLWRRRAICRI